MSCIGCRKRKVAISSGPTPHYEEVHREVVENHTQVLATRCYAAGILILDSWIVPEENAEVAVRLHEVTNIPVGAYLYTPQYGYFKISQWNPQTGTVGLLNDDLLSTSEPGSYVSANTIFTVTPKPCCEDETSTLFAYVAEDFVAQEVGQQLTIQVTSTFGLRVQDSVRISNGVYKLQQINSSKEIVILNEGAGIAPGTTVEALDANGEYQYLIISENASACSAPTTEEGRIIVCEGNLEKILSGSYPDQVPVLIDAAGSLVQFKFLDAEVRVCTELTENVEIEDDVTNYVIQVVATDGFTAGETIQLDFGQLRFVIDAIGPTSLDIHFIPEDIGGPGYNTTILTGSTVCKILTSEFLLSQLDGSGEGIQSQINAIVTQIAGIHEDIAQLTVALEAEEAARILADAELTTEFQAADEMLQDNLNNEILARITDVNLEETNRIADVNQEESDRMAADAVETAARTAADATLQAQIDVVFNTYINQYRENASKVTGGVGGPFLLTVAGTTSASPVAETVITNTGTRNMVGLFQAEANINATWDSTVASIPKLTFECISAMTTGPIGTTVMGAFDASTGFPDQRSIPAGSNLILGACVPHSRAFIIPAGHEVRCTVAGRVTLNALNAANHLEDIYFETFLSVLCVAI